MLDSARVFLGSCYQALVRRINDYFDPPFPTTLSELPACQLQDMKCVLSAHVHRYEREAQDPNATEEARTTALEYLAKFEAVYDKVAAQYEKTRAEEELQVQAQRARDQNRKDRYEAFVRRIPFARRLRDYIYPPHPTRLNELPSCQLEDMKVVLSAHARRCQGEVQYPDATREARITALAHLAKFEAAYEKVAAQYDKTRAEEELQEQAKRARDQNKKDRPLLSKMKMRRGYIFIMIAVLFFFFFKAAS
ncbi:hypothetical protein FB451DRAFT_1526086 [Mycena latifolia]|nr:hypothetical protein FB451DRAFT_1526086 [Mycena latifolia]